TRDYSFATVTPRSDTYRTLAVASRYSTTTSTTSTYTFSLHDALPILSATVSATGSTVNAGTVTFQVKNGSTNVGSAVTSGTVSSSAAPTSYFLSPFTPAWPHPLVTTYKPSSHFHSTSDTSRTLTLGAR